MKTFKDYWEAPNIISYKDYIKKYKTSSVLEKIILLMPYNNWEWDYISSNTIDISINFIREMYMFVNWKKVSKRKDINEKFIIEFEKKIDFNLIDYSNLSIYFIRRYRHFLNWDTISYAVNFDNNFYNEFKYYINWKILSNQNISEEFIDKYSKFIDWEIISSKGNLTNDFLIKNLDKLYYNSLNMENTLILLNYKYYINKIEKWYKKIKINREFKKTVYNTIKLYHFEYIMKKITIILIYTKKKYKLLLLIFLLMLMIFLFKLYLYYNNIWKI